MSAPSVQRFSHLVKLKRADEAKHMLERVANLVKPLMRRHSWTLPLLSEMFPKNPSLLGLNINGGQKILLRLRPHHASDTFLELEEVVQTMLHELAHNVHGPHDAKFYAFLSKLQAEYDAGVRNGWAGDGFFSPGIRVGMGKSHDVPMHLAREKALRAIEERERLRRLMAGGKTLGGMSPSAAGKSPRELAAEAAERRLRDDKACGVDAAVEAAKADKDGVIEINDEEELATGDSPATLLPAPLSYPPGCSQSAPEVAPPAKRKADVVKDESDDEIQIIEPLSHTPAFSSSSDKPLEPSASHRSPVRERRLGLRRVTSMAVDSSSRAAPVTLSRPPPRATSPAATPASNICSDPQPTPEDTIWPCPACTFHNPLSSLSCDLCATRRPPLTSGQKAQLERQGWTCNSCGRKGIGAEWWCCTTVGCGGTRGYS